MTMDEFEARKMAIDLVETIVRLRGLSTSDLLCCRDDIERALRGIRSLNHRFDNPWNPECWNMTEQARIYRQDPVLAHEMAAKHRKLISEPLGYVETEGSA